MRLKSLKSHPYVSASVGGNLGKSQSICRRGAALATVVVAMILLLGFTLPLAGASKRDQSPPPGTTVASLKAAPPEYIIGPTDVLDVSVWKEPDISRTVTVRPDGKISLPLVGELEASGMTPVQLQAIISQRLEHYIASPEVTILLHDIRSGAVAIFGKVAKPGSYPLARQMTVLDVIAAAGGFKDYAKLTQIYVLRINPDGTTVRYKFNFKEVIKGRDLSQNIALLPRDTIYVP